MGIILGVAVALTAFVLISRRLAKRFEPRFLQAQKQLQSGASSLAMNTLEQLLPLARWQVMLKGQIYAQMGILAYASENEDLAVEYLEKSALRAPDARMALAAIYFRRKNPSKAFEIMELAVRGNKKQILPYHAYAWMLSRKGETDKAIEQIRRALKVEKSSESSKENLLRLQNNRKLSMKRFGMQWYALKLEKPPASMRQYQPGTHRGMRGRQRKQKRRG
jgi:tetratricopeptide (TPR) repeat protein